MFPVLQHLLPVFHWSVCVYAGGGGEALRGLWRVRSILAQKAHIAESPNLESAATKRVVIPLG